MIRLTGIGHVLLRVSDVERSKAFYSTVLGLQVTEQDPEHGGVFMALEGHAHSIDLFPVTNQDDSAPRPSGSLGLGHVAFRVSSEEALRIGLVNRLYPPDQLREQTYAYARDLADYVSPSAMAVIKRQLYDVPFQTLAEATIDANREMVSALRGSDFREGVASFMEKRPPRFTGK